MNTPIIILSQRHNPSPAQALAFFTLKKLLKHNNKGMLGETLCPTLEVFTLNLSLDSQGPEFRYENTDELIAYREKFFGKWQHN